MSKGKQDIVKEAEKMIEMVKTSPGFCLFIARVSQDKDKDGNRKIEYSYARHKMDFNEVAGAVNRFNAHYIKDREGVS